MAEQILNDSIDGLERLDLLCRKLMVLSKSLSNDLFLARRTTEGSRHLTVNRLARAHLVIKRWKQHARLSGCWQSGPGVLP
jgi:hypothetical protein